MILDAIIFDLEGTLADTQDATVAAYRDTLLEFTGRRFSDGEILALLGPSEEGVFERQVPRHWQACVAAFQDNFERAHASIRDPFPGLERVFELLGSLGVKMAIATDKGPGSTAISIRNLGLATYFDLIETGSPTGNSKVKAIERLVARWNTAPSFVAYLGDEVSDMAAARVARVQGLAAAWSPAASAQELQAARPRAVFPTVPSLEQWLRENVQGPNAV